MIYQGVCLSCPPLLDTEGQVVTKSTSVYVGETSRPWRERVREHREGINEFDPKSVFLEHWMSKHGCDAVCPIIEFEILDTYSDPLRRQITEALYIMERGSLNRKTEFGFNDICRFEAKDHFQVQEDGWRSEFSRRKLTTEKMKNFTAVMSNVVDLCCDLKVSKKMPLSKKRPISRLKHNQTSVPGAKRQKRMETSTPLSKQQQYREKSEEEDFGSPITGELSSASSGGSSGIAGIGHTQVSDDLGTAIITPPKAMTSSMEEKHIALKSLQVTWAAVGINLIKKTESLPDLVGNVSNNALFSKYPSRVKVLPILPRVRALSENDVYQEMEVDISGWSENDFVLVKSPAKIPPAVQAPAPSIDVSEAKPSAILLGLDASKEILQEPATPARNPIKRLLDVSPETGVLKTRRHSMDDVSMSPRLRAIRAGDGVARERSGTWSENRSPKRYNKYKKKMPASVDKKQPLISTAFLKVNGGKGEEVKVPMNDEVIIQ